MGLKHIRQSKLQVCAGKVVKVVGCFIMLILSLFY